MAVTRVATTAHVAHGKLHKTGMFHAPRKRGPRKQVTGMHCRFLVAPCVDTHVTMKLKLSDTICPFL